MNILIYTRQNIFQARGGIERVATVLAESFKQDGHKVHYLYGDCTEKTVSHAISEHQIQVILNHEGNDLMRTRILRGAIPPQQVRLVSLLHLSPTHCTDCFRASLSDLFQSGLSFADKLRMLLRNSWIYRTIYSRYFGKCYASVYSLSDAVVLLSDRFREPYMQLTRIQDSSHLFCIPNPLTLPSANGESEKQKTVIFVSRLTFHEKRPDLMLQIWQQVFTQHPDWQLIIVGEGNYRPIMERKVAEQKMANVTFAGCVDAADYYSAASILCMTSNSEGFGLVLTEASSRQVVPLCFDSVQTAQDIILNGETGYIIPSFDVREYAEKLSILMRRDALREQMAASAPKYVSQRFDRQTILKQWYQVLNP